MHAWNGCSVRLYEEVQEFHIHVVVDASASMAEPFAEKRINALRLAVALSYLGLISQHRVSLYAMRERITEILPSQKGQGNIQRIVETLRSLEFGGMTRLRQCLGASVPPGNVTA